ncbi:hypothetical protein N7530_006611 [Penicillium desertorum]|uniref:Uncharacterized protein n=1 Tax=Penicillium desertorum TaxID=1303715 RepID=A0A9X0BMB4_9EURO|nr:hypothetical protein N7530_006611 [Penicillium desertorum]
MATLRTAPVNRGEGDRPDGCRPHTFDHMWSQILRFYFSLQEGYGLEREPYTAEDAQARTNIEVTNIRDDTIVKALFVECKAPRSATATKTQWEKRRPNWKTIC